MPRVALPPIHCQFDPGVIWAGAVGSANTLTAKFGAEASLEDSTVAEGAEASPALDSESVQELSVLAPSAGPSRRSKMEQHRVVSASVSVRV